MKRQYFYIFLLLFALFWLELGFKKVFPASSLIPQFVLMFVVAIAVNRDLKEALTVAVIGGLVGDFFSTLYFGSVIWSMIVACLIAFFISRSVTARVLSLSNAILLQGLITVVLPLTVFGYNLFFAGLGFIDMPTLSDFYAWSLLWRIAANIAVFMPVSLLLKRIYHE